MLPNLGRLSLCHREAATSADDEGPLGKRGGKAALHPIAEEGSSSSDPDPKRPRAAANRYPPPSKSIEVLPGGKPTPSGEPTRASNAFDEADDPETDPGYKSLLEDHNELVENGREELRKRFPLEKVTPLDKSVYENYKEFFQNVLTVDEPTVSMTESMAPTSWKWTSSGEAAPCIAASATARMPNARQLASFTGSGRDDALIMSRITETVRRGP